MTEIEGDKGRGRKREKRTWAERVIEKVTVRQNVRDADEEREATKKGRKKPEKSKRG